MTEFFQKYTVTDFGFGAGPHYVVSDRTGQLLSYLTEAQAKKGAERRPGTRPTRRVRNGEPVGSWLLVTT